MPSTVATGVSPAVDISNTSMEPGWASFTTAEGPTSSCTAGSVGPGLAVPPASGMMRSTYALHHLFEAPQALRQLALQLGRRRHRRRVVGKLLAAALGPARLTADALAVAGRRILAADLASPACVLRTWFSLAGTTVPNQRGGHGRGGSLHSQQLWVPLRTFLRRASSSLRRERLEELSLREGVVSLLLPRLMVEEGGTLHRRQACCDLPPVS